MPQPSIIVCGISLLVLYRAIYTSDRFASIIGHISVPGASVLNAMPMRVFIPHAGMPSPYARPIVVAIPMRRPVKLPGPVDTAIQSIESMEILASSISSRINPVRSSQWDKWESLWSS